jgi:hypothetical protein
MHIDKKHTIDLIKRTPGIIRTLLYDISEDLAHSDEGGETWSPYDVVGHLIHGEKTDWIPRLNKVLGPIENKTFVPFDRFAQFEESAGKSLNQLIDEFEEIRKKNIAILESMELNDEDYNKHGIHPSFGAVTLTQLLTTWIVHDLNHIAQISRVIAHQHRDDVGPWVDYMRILKSDRK